VVTERLLERRDRAPLTAAYLARRKVIDYGLYARYRGILHT
jgi:hydroxymethylglutaryl-CoA synthase